MPIDADEGRALAARLNDQYTGRIETVVFTYDPYAESDRINGNPLCTISPFNLNPIRNDRERWRRDIELLIMMLVAQPPNADAKFFDEYLDAWDDVLGVAAADARVSEMAIESRYELEQSQTQKRLVTRAVLTLPFQRSF